MWWAVIFAKAWQGWLPVAQMAGGTVAVMLAVHLNHPRSWALFLTLPLLCALACGGAPWAIWLMTKGVFTALTVFAPGWALLAFLVVLATMGETLRVSRARAAADLETAQLTAEAAAVGYGYAGGGARGSDWVLPAMLSAAALPVAAFITAVGWPDTWALISFRWPGTSTPRSSSSPSPRPRCWGSWTRWPMTWRGPWLPKPARATHGRPRWRCGPQGGRRSCPCGSPTACGAAGVFYSRESLFSRSFDPAVHRTPDAVHLDCDQLVYAFTHVAWRLDLAMKPVLAPYHMYLRYDGPGVEPPIYVETTEFRNVVVTEYSVDYLGEKLGEDFIIAEDYFPSGRGGTWANDTIREAAALYQPMAERDIKDSILSNVLVGVQRSGRADPYPEASEARLPGTRSMELVSNLYGWCAAATRAREIRASHGPLLIRYDTPEEEVLTTVALMEAEARGELPPAEP